MVEIQESEGSADPAVLEQFEQTLGHRLPDQYRKFVLEYNGGTPEPDRFDDIEGKRCSTVHYFSGFNGGHYDILNLLKVFAGRIPKRFIPIATDDFGNLICISVSGADAGSIYFWDHEREAGEDQSAETADNMTVLANCFDNFLNGLSE